MLEQEYRISRGDLAHWCAIPSQALDRHPESKVSLVIQPEKNS